MSFFPPVKKWTVPKSALVDSLEEMARDGRWRNEGIMLWLGRRGEGEAIITHLLALRGPGIVKQPQLLIIRSYLLNAVTDITARLKVALLGQIHSHGGKQVDLSPTDRKYGVIVPYYLSVVAPEYALNKETSIADCGVHIFEEGSGYRRLEGWEIAQRIEVVEGQRPPLLIAGRHRNG